MAAASCSFKEGTTDSARMRAKPEMVAADPVAVRTASGKVAPPRRLRARLAAAGEERVAAVAVERRPKEKAINALDDMALMHFVDGIGVAWAKCSHHLKKFELGENPGDLHVSVCYLAFSMLDTNDDSYTHTRNEQNGHGARANSDTTHRQQKSKNACNPSTPSTLYITLRRPTSHAPMHQPP